MTSRITSKFLDLKHTDCKAFIPFLTAGDPAPETTVELIIEFERQGADIIELGVPFSDPMADGPVIQRSSERALRNGINVRDCLKIVQQVRKSSDVPIVLFSYFNPLLAFGLDSIADAMAGAGVDGVLVTDLIPEEASEFRSRLNASGIDTIFLVAPTSTDERLRLAAEASSGFIYAVSRTGVTGVRQSLSEAALNLVRRLRRFMNLPVAVGFGVSNPDHVNSIWQHADAAVVGSRLVAEIERHNNSPKLVERAGDLVKWLASG
jgi:tryptophan synthase alpha chain